MSLEEFLGDDSLGESVWNEDDINLDAINNTTSIEVLKNTRTQEHQHYPHSNVMTHQHSEDGTRSSSAFHHNFNINNTTNTRQPIHSRSNTDHYGSTHQPQLEHHQPPQPPIIQGPPYIVKFSNLPPSFANFDIEELFEAKYTKFVKFKIFWEINKNPSLSTLKSGSIFDQNFKREAKVAFVELFSGRDLMKILKYWSEPLKEIYKINIGPAQFDDFKEYMSKLDILTDPKDDPSKPYVVPKPKPNPFGTAKPVDTQSKILDIEEKMERLHVEDTETLRRLSEGEPLESLKPKVKILKKPQLSYSQVAAHSLMENTKKNSTPGIYSNKASMSPTSGQATLNISEHDDEFKNNEDLSQKEPRVEEEGRSQDTNITMESKETTTDVTPTNDELSPDADGDAYGENHEGTPKSFTFKNQEREVTPNSSNDNNGRPQNYNRSYRGGRGDFKGRGGRGGRGGNYSRGSNYRGRGVFNKHFNGGANNYNRNNSLDGHSSQGKDDAPSLFAPASGFLQGSGGRERGGSSGSSRGRGGYRRGHSNYRGGFN